MRACFALFALLFSLAASAQSFPPSPKVLVAVNPITNKVYVANEFANTVTVLDAATNTTRTIAVGSRPQFILVNPLTNRIFVNNAGEASLTVIDGATDTNLTPTPYPIGSQGPMAINTESNILYIVRMTSLATDEVTFFNANTNTWYTIATESFQPTALAVNSATDTIYVAHYGTGDVRVIGGAFDSNNFHPVTFSIGAWSHPFAIAANSNTNKIYVITEDSRGPIGIIDGATRTAVFPLPAAGHARGPKALAVNPVTNRVYAAFAGEVVVIDGGNNSYAYVPVATGSGPASIGINYFTNKVYVAGSGGTITVIDGFTNATSSIAIPSGAISAGVNPMTNEVIVAGDSTGIVDGATGPFVGIPVQTTINPLPGNTSGPSGSITMTASNGFPNPLPIRGVFFQLDSLDGAWTRASGTGNGPYTASFSSLAPGPHTIYAFAAEGHIAPSDTGPGSNPLFGNITTYNFTVSGSLATPGVAVASSVNPSTVGQPVTFTATVTGSGATPTGTVRFADGSTTITGCSAVALASGSAACTTSALTAGSRTITAFYSGNAGYNPASGTVTQTVNKVTATAALASTPNPSTSGQSVTFTATISAASGGTPVGTVSFTEGGTALPGCSAVALSAGAASCSIATLATGAHTVTATYSGSATHSTATATTTQNVNVASSAVAVTSSANPSLVGQSVTFTARVTSSGATPTGSVTFLDGATTLCSAVAIASGAATCSSAALAAGSHTITANYSGDSTHASASGTLPQNVDKLASSVSIASSSNPSVAGETVTFTATVIGNGATPTGTVTFSIGASTLCGGPVAMSAGGAACSQVLDGGSYTITASYSGSPTYNTSSATLAQVVDANAVPAVPTQVGPSGTITSTQNPTYTWNASAGATSYWLRLRNGEGGVWTDRAVTAADAGCTSGSGTCSFRPGAPVPNNTSWTWVVAASNANGMSAFSAGLQITVAVPPPEVPAVPTQVGPSGTITSTQNPTYTWNASAGATGYWLRLRNSEGGVWTDRAVTAADAGCSAGTGTCSFRPGAPVPNNTSWTWVVAASNASGMSAFSAGLPITVAVPPPEVPAVPTQVGPSGTITSTQNPTYTWNASAGATGYWLRLRNSEGGVWTDRAVTASDAGCTSGTGTCSFRPGAPVPNNTSWTWVVAASNANGMSAFSAGMPITVAVPPNIPATPAQVGPSGTITLTFNPTYTWSASSGATSYWLRLQNAGGVWTDRAVTAAEARCEAGTGNCSFTPGAPVPNDTSWTWVVAAANENGMSPFSSGLPITVSVPHVAPGTPSAVSPVGSIPTTTPTYSWNASAGAISYNLLVQNGSGVAVNLRVTSRLAGCPSGTGTCTYTPATPLASGASWDWYVSATNEYGTSAWSARTTFGTP